MFQQRVAIVIPARYGSTRLPGKVLAPIAGKPMIQWTYEIAQQVSRDIPVYIATEDERVVKAVQAFGGTAILTSPDLSSGTDRVAAVARKISADIYVNLQADEPCIPPQAIQLAIQLVDSHRYEMSTVALPLQDSKALHSPQVVKVLLDQSGKAIYFSRLPLPYGSHDQPFLAKQHVGIYVYTQKLLFEFCQWKPSPLELTEKLEQLRACEHGVAIGVATLDARSLAVDTPEDLEAVRLYFEEKRDS